MSLPQGQTDVVSNRRAQKWTRKEQIRRILWAIALPLFRFSPRPLWVWRRALLRLFGAQVCPDVHVYPTVKIDIPWNLRLETGCAIGDRAILYALGPIRVGERVTISQGAHLCAGTHDWHDPSLPLLKPPIEVEADAWICADAFVGPNVRIGAGAIVGARSVAVKDVPQRTIVAGNPARKIGLRDL